MTLAESLLDERTMTSESMRVLKKTLWYKTLSIGLRIEKCASSK